MYLIRGLLAAALFIGLARRRLPGGQLWAAALGVATVIAPPVLVVAAGAALLAARPVRRWSGLRADGRAASADVSLLGELTGLGLSAGLPFVPALGMAARHVHPLLRAEVESVLRRGARHGAPIALGEGSGRAAALYKAAARASATGAPLLGAVADLVSDQHAEHLAMATTRARRLPVRLLFPLALLILPGFLVLAIGPTVLTAIERLAL